MSRCDVARKAWSRLSRFPTSAMRAAWSERREFFQRGSHHRVMKLSSRWWLGAFVMAASCANDFQITQDGHAQQIAGARSSLTMRGDIRVLKVCGDYPTLLGVADSEGASV